MHNISACSGFAAKVLETQPSPCVSVNQGGCSVSVVMLICACANIDLTTNLKFPVSRVFLKTRNTHAHLCLAPVRRVYARASYVGACRPGEARVARVRRSKLFGVCSIQAAMAPLRRRPRPPSPSSAIYLSRAYLNVSNCVTHINYYGLGPACLWYVTIFRVTFLSVTHHVRTYVLCDRHPSEVN